MDNSEIIELAILCMAVDKSPHDEILGARYGRAIDRAFQADPHGARLTTLAVKLQCGKPLQIISDNPESIRRARALGVDLGARIEEFQGSEGVTRVVFRPAPKS